MSSVKRETKKETKKDIKSETKKESKEEIKQETKEETSEMETHSIWYGRLKNKPSEAKFFKEFLTELGKTFIDEEGVTDILSHFWGKSTEELESLIKLQNKREKKVKETFTPELAKPKSAYNLYCKDYAAQCKTKEIKFTLSNASTTWNELSVKGKEKFNKAAEAQKQEYDMKYKSLKGEAVKNGSLAEDKPKGPTTAFFRYLADNREAIKAKLTANGETEKLNTKITVEAGILWKALSEKDKTPYELAYREEKEKYSELIEAWKLKETSRLKKLDGKTEDIKVEESGNASSVVQEVNPEIQVAEKKATEEKEKTSDKKEKVKAEKAPKAEKEPKAEKSSKAEKEPKAEKASKASKAEKAPKAEKVVKKVTLVEADDDDDEDDEE